MPEHDAQWYTAGGAVRVGAWVCVRVLRGSMAGDLE
jgi:hypothetical protein